MPEIKNLSNQSLYLNLPGGKVLKLPPRRTADVTPADLESATLAFHLDHGNVVVVQRETP